MAALACAHLDDRTPFDPQGKDALWRERRRQLYIHDGVVSAKTPLGCPAQMLKCLGRYTEARVTSKPDRGLVRTRNTVTNASGVTLMVYRPLRLMKMRKDARA